MDPLPQNNAADDGDRIYRLPSTAEPGELRTLTAKPRPAQTAAIPADLFEAITDALAETLVADFLEEQAVMVDSPGGMSHPTEAQSRG